MADFPPSIPDRSGTSKLGVPIMGRRSESETWLVKAVGMGLLAGLAGEDLS